MFVGEGMGTGAIMQKANGFSVRFSAKSQYGIDYNQNRFMMC